MIKKIMVSGLFITGFANHLLCMENPAVKYSVMTTAVCCCCNVVGTTLYALYVQSNHDYYEQRNVINRAQREVTQQRQANLLLKQRQENAGLVARIIGHEDRA